MIPSEIYLFFGDIFWKISGFKINLYYSTLELSGMLPLTPLSLLHSGSRTRRPAGTPVVSSNALALARPMATHCH